MFTVSILLAVALTTITLGVLIFLAVREAWKKRPRLLRRRRSS